MAAAEETPSSPKYDLTPRMAPFLDRHLVFPLLEFLSKKDIYPQREVTRSKIELMSKTHMIDYIIDTHNKLGEGPAPAGLNERRTEVVNKLKQLKTECAPLTKLLDDQNLVKQLKANKQFNMPYLIENHEVTPASLDALFNFAKFQFECGQYSNTADQLYHYRALSSDQDKCFSALWGKFGAEILILDWDTALDTLNRLREEIDNRNPAFTPVQQLQQRTWLIHWSLFVFFNHPNGRNGIIDLFFQDKYINAIQTACPHILRYLTTAVITNKRRRNVLKDLVNVIQQERYTYRDPITEFLECLYVNFDFERAQQKLRECAEVLNNDFFLVACRDDFMNNARLFIFETYCRIHSTIDIDMLAEKLSMKRDEAEKWIVNLIRGARMDNAKIDSKANRVIMGTQYPTVYQQVIEKTKGLSFHSLVLANSIERREAEMQNAREGN